MGLTYKELHGLAQEVETPFIAPAGGACARPTDRCQH